MPKLSDDAFAVLAMLPGLVEGQTGAYVSEMSDDLFGKCDKLTRHRVIAALAEIEVWLCIRFRAHLVKRIALRLQGDAPAFESWGIPAFAAKARDRHCLANRRAAQLYEVEDDATTERRQPACVAT